MLKILIALSLSVSAAPLAAQTGTPGDDTPISPALISRADALDLANRALAACEARHEHASVFVADADGNLRVVESSDNAPTIGLATARRKLAAVLAFHASSSDLQKRVASDQAFAAQYGNDPRYFWHPGALPIYRDGKFVAVLAVGGGHHADEQCALDALATVPWAKTSP